MEYCLRNLHPNCFLLILDHNIISWGVADFLNFLLFSFVFLELKIFLMLLLVLPFPRGGIKGGVWKIIYFELAHPFVPSGHFPSERGKG